MKDCAQNTPQQPWTKLNDEMVALNDKYRRQKEKVATKYAKYKVGDKIRHNNWPHSRSKTGIIESITVELLDDYVVCYWVDYPNGRYGQVYESEIL